MRYAQFAALLRQHQERKGLTVRSLAKTLDASAGYIGDILNERIGPPDEDRLKQWAKSLGLQGDDMHAFMLEGGMARAFSSVVDHVHDLEGQVSELKRQLRVDPPSK